MTILMLDTHYSMRNRIAELKQQLREANAYNEFLQNENTILACELAQAKDYIQSLEEVRPYD
jgi:predicted nuclease with TOPRIM domain